jgi:hypothetical protein
LPIANNAAASRLDHCRDYALPHSGPARKKDCHFRRVEAVGCPPASAFDKTAYRNASTRETYAPSLARGHWSLGRSGVVLCAVRRHRSSVACDDDTLTPILMEGFRHK